MGVEKDERSLDLVLSSLSSTLKTNRDEFNPVRETMYRERAELHRPTEREALRLEVLRLRAQGLRPRDIGQLLRMNDAEVVTLIAGDIS